MTRKSWRRVQVHAIGYILCVFACRYVVQFAASEAAHLVYQLKYPSARIDSTNLAHFYVDNWLVFNLLAGIACGSAVYSVWRSLTATLVWVPSFCLLCQRILTHPHSVMAASSLRSDIFYFISAGCAEISDFYISQRCTEQLEFSVPFYAAVGFSTGTLISLIYGQRKGQFESLPSPDSSDDSAETVDEHRQSPENQGATGK